MTIKSTPPASSNFAVIPVPAPPPIIGLPAVISLRIRLRICCLGCAIRGFSLLNKLNHQLHGLDGELRLVDVSIHLEERNSRSQTFLDRVEHGLISGTIA